VSQKKDTFKIEDLPAIVRRPNITSHSWQQLINKSARDIITALHK